MPVGRNGLKFLALFQKQGRNHCGGTMKLPNPLQGRIMKTTSLRHSLRAVAVASLFALGATAVHAAGPGMGGHDGTQGSRADCVQSGQGGKHVRMGKEHMHRHLHDAALLVPGYGPVGADFVKSLELNDHQAALLKSAQDAQKTLRESHQGQGRDGMKARAQALKDGTLDPKAALAAHDERRQAMQAEHRQIQEKWLAVWDALTPDQQQKVGAHLQERTAKFQERMERRMERHGQRQSS